MLCLSLGNLSQESMEKYVQLIEEGSNFNVNVTSDTVIVKEKEKEKEKSSSGGSNSKSVDDLLNEEKSKLDEDSSKVFSSLCLNSLFDICDCKTIEGKKINIYIYIHIIYTLIKKKKKYINN